MKRISINCDMGEGLGNESSIMPYIDACNIACGGHAGDSDIMTHVVQLAISNSVSIGAHPSYPDTSNFGRKTMVLERSELIETVRKQLDLLASIVKENHGKIDHIKAHGALYNDLAQNSELADAYLEALESYKYRCNIFVPYNSVIAEQAEKSGFTVIYEAFADRNYNDDLSLVSRSQNNAVLSEITDVVAHVDTMLKLSRVRTIDGKLIPLKADTFCVHSDTPNALIILKALSDKFKQ